MSGYDSEWEGHRGSFEGATTQMAEHILDEHAEGLTADDIATLTKIKVQGGFTQGEWIAVDRIHAKVHGKGDGSGYPGSRPIIVASAVVVGSSETVTAERPWDDEGWKPVAAILRAKGVTSLVVSHDDGRPDVTYTVRGLVR